MTMRILLQWWDPLSRCQVHRNSLCACCLLGYKNLLASVNFCSIPIVDCLLFPLTIHTYIFIYVCIYTHTYTHSLLRIYTYIYIWYCVHIWRERLLQDEHSIYQIKEKGTQILLILLLIIFSGIGLFCISTKICYVNLKWHKSEKKYIRLIMLNSAYFENMVLYSTLLNKIHLTWL